MTIARDAEARQDYDIAVAEYTKLLRENPDHKDARLGLERAKLRASQDHFARGRRLAATGKLEEALVEYQIASELNPANSDIQTELQDTRRQLRTKVAVREDGKTRLESLIDQSLEAPLPGADLPDGCEAARHPGVPRRQRPRRLLRDRQVHQPQRRVRSDVPRSGRSRSICATPRSKRR